jgi:hypothetical protein
MSQDLAWLNDTLMVNIYQITVDKKSYPQPLWSFYFQNNCRVDLFAGGIESQRLFRIDLMKHCQIVPKKLKGDKWDEVIREILAKAIPI